MLLKGYYSSEKPQIFGNMPFHFGCIDFETFLVMFKVHIRKYALAFK